jgi:bacterioferritin (cytochrome b1)
MSEMIGEDLLLERQQIERYTILARKIQATDPVTWTIVVQILAQSEKHATELADFLSRNTDTL